MLRVVFVLRVMFFLLPLLLPVASRADEIDQAELTFWQSIQNSTDPREYQAYLDAYPHGKFAKLAIIRAHPAAPAAAAPAAAAKPAPPAAQTATAPTTDDTGADTPAGTMVLEPAAPRVGQSFRITCEGFPQPSTFDKLVIVPAGTPVMDPDRPADQTKAVWFAYAVSCYHLPVQAGPFAPGAYELRFMTRLYNNNGVSEMHASTSFRVR